MGQKKEFKIGMIGLGTVGTGVLELLHRRSEDLARRLGRGIEVRRIAVRDMSRQRNFIAGFNLGDLLTSEVGDVVKDPEIDLVVEVAGGVDGARRWILEALDRGKDVVTANKAVLALHGAEIFERARQGGRKIYYEASVAAAIPIIDMLQNGLVANQLTRLWGILNGTSNYILTRMEEDRLDFATALRMAQAKGFAEADPTLDISGGDSAHKLALLMGIITRSYIPMERIFIEGIERVTPEDIEFARKLGYRIKLLAIGKQREEGSWELRVHPTFIPRDDMIAQVGNEFNAVSLRGDAMGPMLIYGKGAGSHPTASSIVADILRAARGGDSGGDAHGQPPPAVVPMDQVSLRHYIRLRVRDNPGVMGRVTSHFGMRGISIASMQQPEAKMGHPVPVVFVTHVCEDRVITRAIRDLESAGLVEGLTTRIRMEE
jgi:homoserine dehydrogenase